MLLDAAIYAAADIEGYLEDLKVLQRCCWLGPATSVLFIVDCTLGESNIDLLMCLAAAGHNSCYHDVVVTANEQGCGC